MLSEASEIDLAYIAGFFDGEGCIAAQINNHGYTALHVRIGQVVVAPLTFIQQRFGGALNEYTKKNGDHCWYLEWSGRTALPILEAMVPYLIVKRHQAELAIEWCSLGYIPGSSKAAVKLGEKRVSLANSTRRLEIVRELKDAKKAG